MSQIRKLNILAPPPPPRSLSPLRLKKKPKSTPKELQSSEDTSPQSLDKTSPEYITKLLSSLYSPYSTKSNYQDHLPNLTSSLKVDQQLYIIVGLLMNQFINRWFLGLSANKDFQIECLATFTHLIKDLTLRFQTLDLIEFSNKLCFVVNNHVMKISSLGKKLNSNLNARVSFEDAFVESDYHVGIVDKDRYLKVMVNKILTNSLPSTISSSELSRNFLNELLADLVLCNSFTKLSQDYFWFQLVSTVISQVKRDNTAESSNKTSSKDDLTDEKPSELTEKDKTSTIQPVKSSLKTKVYRVINRISKLIVYSSNDNSQSQFILVNHQIFSLFDNLFNIASKKPLLYGIISYSRNLIATSSKINSLIENFVNNYINKHSTGICLTIISNIRYFLFPNDIEMGTAPIPPTKEEVLLLKKKAKDDITELLQQYPQYLSLLSVEESDINKFLSAFDYEKVNYCLIINLLDCIVSEVYPELL